MPVIAMDLEDLMGQYGIVWNRGVVEVGGFEPAYSLVNSRPCGVWCP